MIKKNTERHVNIKNIQFRKQFQTTSITAMVFKATFNKFQLFRCGSNNMKELYNLGKIIFRELKLRSDML